jgi:tryptophan-rich sensory protein
MRLIKNLGILMIFVFIAFLPGIIGSFFTELSVGTWYLDLKKPNFSPPGWIFGPVWTFLYFLMGIASFWVFKKRYATNKIIFVYAMFFYAWQLVFNGLWSVIFFGLRSPFWALMEIIALLLLIGANMIFFYRISKVASILLIPYFLWVNFAFVLNFAIVLLN